jgi:hypothetical protein
MSRASALVIERRGVHGMLIVTATGGPHQHAEQIHQCRGARVHGRLPVFSNDTCYREAGYDRRPAIPTRSGLLLKSSHPVSGAIAADGSMSVSTTSAWSGAARSPQPFFTTKESRDRRFLSLANSGVRLERIARRPQAREAW